MIRVVLVFASFVSGYVWGHLAKFFKAGRHQPREQCKAKDGTQSCDSGVSGLRANRRPRRLQGRPGTSHSIRCFLKRLGRQLW